MDGPSLAEMLVAAEPTSPRPLTELVAWLRQAGETVDVISPPAASSASSGMIGSGTMIRGVTADSRTATAGAIFVAIPGALADGHAHAAAAVRAGAAALLVEHAVADVAVPQVVVTRTRPTLAEIAAWWYGEPSRELGVVGVTGTDGKTTTSFLAAAALGRAGIPTGLIGTVATQIGGRREPNPDHSTTPEAPALQRALRAMVRAGDCAAIIETTSHGLAMDRVAAVGYDIAILTNLTHEHLELHGTFEAYRAAKVSLFERLATGPRNPAKPGVGWPRAGIVNADDPSAAVFADATRRAGARLLTYGTTPRADVRLAGVQESPSRLTVRYDAPSGPGALALRLAGRFNAHNALAVVALGEVLGLDPATVRAGLEAVPGVPGRMERVDAGQPFAVIVDYAHSPASLALVLDELGPLASAGGGGLIAVFGSAGERDREKRPLMGRIAAERCRLVIVTDEDPRGEDRAAILEEIAVGAESAGARRGANIELIPDRRAAIEHALASARAGDVVLLAGKGHETTILTADGPVPWDERGEAAAALAELGWTG
jgi:UDP-N-acetylmuramoyl-L-alanyl-D-glutamate--2,6-diaminopimelate ligase